MPSKMLRRCSTETIFSQLKYRKRLGSVCSSISCADLDGLYASLSNTSRAGVTVRRSRGAVRLTREITARSRGVSGRRGRSPPPSARTGTASPNGYEPVVFLRSAGDGGAKTTVPSRPPAGRTRNRRWNHPETERTQPVTFLNAGSPIRRERTAPSDRSRHVHRHPPRGA